MTKLALSGWEEPAETGENYPHKLSSPMPFFWTMVIFLIIVGFVAAILFRQAHAAFVSNPGLNGLILGVLAIGILLVFSHVLSLRPEVRWFNSFRAAGSAEKVGRDPVLLAPMRALIGKHHADRDLDHRAALDPRFDRHPARRIARHLALSHRPARLPRPARHLLGPARHDRLDQHRHPVARCRGRDGKRRADGAEGRPVRAAVGHGHGLLDLAVRPFRFADPGLSRPAGGAGAEPLLHRAGELAHLGHRRLLRNVAGRPRPMAAMPWTSGRSPSRSSSFRRKAATAARLRPWRASPKASRVSSRTCAASSRCCATGSRRNRTRPRRCAARSTAWRRATAI